MLAGRILSIFISLFFASAVLLSSSRVEAQAFTHQLMRRLVIFPLKTESSLKVPAEDAWWQVREEITGSRRFLVASKQFLMKSDVYQSRGDLEPADAIILGKLLDAHSLLTLQLSDRKLTLTAYDGSHGLILYRSSLNLHPSLAASEQLAPVSKKLINNFVASIPYQGFTTVDSLIGQPVYNEGDVKMAQVDLGIGSRAQMGDLVQWIKVGSTNVNPLFQGGSKITVFAEGKVVRLNEGVATVEITRATSIKEIAEYSLVRLPREAERLASEYSIADKPRATLSPELVSPEARPMEQVARERRPLITTLSFVASIAAYLLLAF